MSGSFKSMEKYEVLGPVTSGTVYVDGRSYCSKARSLTRSCMKLIDDFISGWHGTRGIGRFYLDLGGLRTDMGWPDEDGSPYMRVAWEQWQMS